MRHNWQLLPQRGKQLRQISEHFTVDPGNGDRFEKNGDQNRVLGRETFQ